MQEATTGNIAVTGTPEEVRLEDAIKTAHTVAWTREEAVELLAGLDARLRPVGFACGLTGSVLTKGFSDNDLDIIVFPLSTIKYDIGPARLALIEFGMRQQCSKGQTIVTWERKGSDDFKHVEIWRTQTNKRVDVFFMR